jgi:hypothetical protein
MSNRLSRGIPSSVIVLTALVVTDSVIVLASVRLIGVDDGLPPLVIVLGSVCVVCPLIALPLAGLGALDAALVVAFTETAGVAAEPEMPAALVVGQVVTILGALLLGMLTFGWRRWLTTSGRGLPAHEDLGADLDVELG